MSAARPQPAIERNPGFADSAALFGHLLHALNQPLTGLHCSLELALAASRRPEYYVRILREGLCLTARMRTLVEALRELADTGGRDSAKLEVVGLDGLLTNAVEELEPVAHAKYVHLRLTAGNALPVRADCERLRHTSFRLLEAIVSLSEEYCAVQLMAASEGDHAVIIVSWTQAEVPEHSPFSRGELGLMLARASWEQAGGSWVEVQDHSTRLFTLRFPLCAEPESPRV